MYLRAPSPAAVGRAQQVTAPVKQAPTAKKAPAKKAPAKKAAPLKAVDGPGGSGQEGDGPPAKKAGRLDAESPAEGVEIELEDVVARGRSRPWSSSRPVR